MQKRRWQLLFGAVALVAAIWAVWAQTGGFEYILLDDNLYTFDYAPVAGGLSWTGFKAVCANLTQGGIWMPLTSLSYMIDISLFGAGAGPHHLMSIAWHSVNALLAFYLIYELTDRKSVFAAFAGAAFWAIHPQRCESVAWIASRKDLVFTFFMLLGLIAWRRGWTWAAYLLMAASCLGKPTGMVFPALAFCVEREVPLFFSKLKHAPTQTLKNYFIRYLPMVALTVVTAAIAVYSQTYNPEEGISRGLNEAYGCFAWRCLNATVSLGLYFAQLVFPYGLHIMYRPFCDGIPAGMWFGLFVSALLGAGCVWVFVRHRRWGLFWRMAFWFLAAIGPTLGVAGSFGDHARADRFLYLPMIAVSVLVAWGLCRAGRWWRVGAVAALCAYAAVTFVHTATYHDDYTVFQRVIDRDDGHFHAYHHVATEMLRRFHDPESAIAIYRKMISIRPEDKVGGKLMFALATRGRREDFGEIRYLGAKLADEPGLDKEGFGLEALGMIAMREGKWDEAIRFFRGAVAAPKRDQPTDAARVQLAMCLYNRGDYAEAKGIFGTLTGSKDERVRRHAGAALERIRRKEEAFNQGKQGEKK